MKPLCQHAYFLSHTSVHFLHLRVKLPFGDANDRGGCYPQTSAHTRKRIHLQGLGDFLWLRACVHLLLYRSVYLPVFMSWLLSLLFFCPPPPSSPSTFLPSTFLPSTPCNLTLSTLVSCLFANTDCSRLGLDFPVLTSSLLYLSEYLNTHSPFTHSLALMCFSSPIPSLHLFDF